MGKKFRSFRKHNFPIDPDRYYCKCSSCGRVWDLGHEKDMLLKRKYGLKCICEERIDFSRVLIGDDILAVRDACLILDSQGYYE